MHKIMAASQQIIFSRKNARHLAVLLPSLVTAVGAIAITLPASAADRVFQVLGVCGLADVQYEGNRKKGRCRLMTGGQENQRI